MTDLYERRKTHFMRIAEELSETFYKKNKDYGDSYFKVGQDGFPIDRQLAKLDFYIQLRRKFSRLADFALRKYQGEEAQALVDDETEDDTIRDIAVYCVMELMKRRLDDAIEVVDDDN